MAIIVNSPESEGFTTIPENEYVPYNPTVSAPPLATSIPDYVPPPDPTYKTAGQVSVMPTEYVNPKPTTPAPIPYYTPSEPKGPGTSGPETVRQGDIVRPKVEPFRIAPITTSK